MTKVDESEEVLDFERARDAVVRALGSQFVVPDRAALVGRATMEFDLLRRGPYYGEPQVYRVRLVDGVLHGSWKGGSPC